MLVGAWAWWGSRKRAQIRVRQSLFRRCLGLTIFKFNMLFPFLTCLILGDYTFDIDNTFALIENHY